VSLRQNGVGTGFIGANAILPKGHDQVFEAARQLLIADQQLLVGLLSPPKTIEQIAAEQGIGPFDFKAAQAEATFWPEDESADDFIAALREWRSEGGEERESD
jgi:hypothetical protein